MKFSNQPYVQPMAVLSRFRKGKPNPCFACEANTQRAFVKIIASASYAAMGKAMLVSEYLFITFCLYDFTYVLIYTHAYIYISKFFTNKSQKIVQNFYEEVSGFIYKPLTLPF